MKRGFLLLIVLLLLVPAAHGQKSERSKSSGLRLGIKTGVNSSMNLISNLSVNGSEVDLPQNNYKLGFKLDFFARYDFNKKHFIQPELSYQDNRCQIECDYDELTQAAIPTDLSVFIDTRIKYVEMPLLYGYYFINDGPYTCSILLGPKVKHPIETRHNLNITGMDTPGNVVETLYPLSYSVVGGLNITVGNLFLDFRLEKGLSNISKKVETPASLSADPTVLQNMIFRRTSEAVSFTAGFIF
jgi:hypothetical protein